ncbi:MAG: RNA polymerase sigma-70 factor [Runella sp.]
MNQPSFYEQQLVVGLQQGRKSAFEEIYNRYWYKLFSIAYHQIGVQEEAEELVQEVFLDIWRRREGIKIEHLDLYLTIAIKNQVYDYIKSKISYRKYQEYLIFQEIQQNFNAYEVINYSELAEAVEKVLGLLPEKSAEVFRKSRFENQSVKEIAESLQLSEKAVEYHITKSLKFLRENLSAYRTDN